MPKVYVPNVPKRINPYSGEWVSAFNLQPALQYGELVVLFEQHEIGAGLAPLMAVIDSRMTGITPEDYIVHVGDPALMGAAARAHQRLLPGHKCRVLVWDKRLNGYLPAEIK